MLEILKAIQRLSEQIREIKDLVLGLRQRKEMLSKEDWIDGQDAMLALRISSRTLRTLRETKKLAYSRIHNKIYYKQEDINALLESNYIRNHLTRSHD